MVDSQRRADLLMLEAAYCRAVNNAEFFAVRAQLAQSVERAEEARADETYWRQRAKQLRTERDDLSAAIGVTV